MHEVSSAHAGSVISHHLNQDGIVVLLTQVPARQTEPFTDRVMKAVAGVFARR